MKAVKSKPKQNTIKMTLYFFTDGLTEGEDMIIPKHAWANGTISLSSNKSHEIKATQVNFNSLMEIPSKIEELLIKGRITIHVGSDKMNYIEKS